jgi:hypothetical protein
MVEPELVEIQVNQTHLNYAQIFLSASLSDQGYKTFYGRNLRIFVIN